MKARTLLILAMLLSLPAFALAKEQCLWAGGENYGGTASVLKAAGMPRNTIIPSKIDAAMEDLRNVYLYSRETMMFYVLSKDTLKWTAGKVDNPQFAPIGGYWINVVPTRNIDSMNYDILSDAYTITSGGTYYIWKDNKWSHVYRLGDSTRGWRPNTMPLPELPSRADVLANFGDAQGKLQTLIGVNSGKGLKEWYTSGARVNPWWNFKLVPYDRLGLRAPKLTTSVQGLVSVDAITVNLVVPKKESVRVKLGKTIIFGTVSGSCKVDKVTKVPWDIQIKNPEQLPVPVPQPGPEQITECVVGVVDRGTASTEGIGAKKVKVFDVKVNGAAGKAVKAEAQYGTAAGNKSDCAVSANANGGSTIKCDCKSGANSIRGVGITIKQGDYTKCSINNTKVNRGAYQTVAVDPCPETVPQEVPGQVPQPGPEQITECVVGVVDKGTETSFAPIGGARAFKVFGVQVNGAAGKAVKADAYYGGSSDNWLGCSLRENNTTLWCPCKYTGNTKSLYAVGIRIKQDDYTKCTINTASVKRGNYQTVTVNPCLENVPVPESSGGAEQLVECKETDGGKDKYVKGTATGKEKYGVAASATKEDYCIGPGTQFTANKPTVVEYYCEGGYLENAPMTCNDKACRDGACTR
ncbi:MAG: hypothetical protein V1676_04495 [Candidatus Diapherotrites archaeon]